MHIHDDEGNLVMIVDYKDTKPLLTWSPKSWKERIKWKIRQMAKKLLP